MTHYGKCRIFLDYPWNKQGDGSTCHVVTENRPLSPLTPFQISMTYASEADVLNVALFGITAKQWREENPEKSRNIRDYATLNQLLVLANMESYNAKKT